MVAQRSSVLWARLWVSAMVASSPGQKFVSCVTLSEKNRPGDEASAMATGGSDLCLVTGASGYIGSHVVQQLLQRGDARVRGTVRDLKSEKAEKLSKFVPDAKYLLELVEARLQNADSWIEAVKGCCQVYHIASPVPRKAPRVENEVIPKPKINPQALQVKVWQHFVQNFFSLQPYSFHYIPCCNCTKLSPTFT